MTPLKICLEWYNTQKNHSNQITLRPITVISRLLTGLYTFYFSWPNSNSMLSPVNDDTRQNLAIWYRMTWACTYSAMPKNRNLSLIPNYTVYMLSSRTSFIHGLGLKSTGILNTRYVTLYIQDAAKTSSLMFLPFSEQLFGHSTKDILWIAKRVI